MNFVVVEDYSCDDLNYIYYFYQKSDEYLWVVVYNEFCFYWYCWLLKK